MSTDGVRCASYLPTDGYLDPSLLTDALIDGARAGRLPRVHAHARRPASTCERRRACAACRPSGAPIEAEVVVNAGGMFAAEIGRLAGVRVPIVPFAHEYLVTQPFRERGGRADQHLPTLRDPDLLIYFREEGGGLVMGGYERQQRAVGARRAPARRDPRRTSTAACSRRTGRASRRSPPTRRGACR